MAKKGYYKVGSPWRRDFRVRGGLYFDSGSYISPYELAKWRD